MWPARFFVGVRRGNLWRKAPRRLLAALLVVAYVIVAAGIPLPIAGRPAKSGELFPCAASGCGCDSAEKCWRSCCCHTLAERLAWAEENGVTPPDFALQAAKDAGLDAGGRPLAKVVNVVLAKASCCREKNCCCKSSTSKRTCCSSHAHRKSTSNASDFVIAWRALGCHGQSLNWLAAVPTLVSADLQLSDQLPLVIWLGPPSSEVATGVADVPTPPPPERA